MQKGTINVQTENIFPIIKKFLYSDHEIFLRELISNAVDATQKLKTLSSMDKVKGELGDLTIHVELDKKKKQLKVIDRGIGMTAEEVDKIYKEKCFACHQLDAKGIPGAFPPLANADYLVADLRRAVAQTLNGSHEEMVVNGETFNAPMVPQVKTIEEAVAVINYVLKEFNGYTDDKLVKIEDVSDIEINPMTVPAQ